MESQENSDRWKPICLTEDEELGDCMSFEQAKEIIEEHEAANPKHSVDILKC